MNKRNKHKLSFAEEFERDFSRTLSRSGVDSVVAGVSGGADSVAMLCALVRTGFRVHAVHCNFHLRGEESDRDERFVRDLCRRLGITLDVVEFDVEKHRSSHGGSVEMACRELRYGYFEEVLTAAGAQRIAVAHNSDDNAETLLLNLFRGCGIAGLRAMKSDTGKIIRPLLGVSRKEIEEYLRALGQEYVIDSTNLSSDYRRNFLRNEVLPLIERQWPDVKRLLNHTSMIMSREEQGSVEMVKELTDADFLEYRQLRKPISGKWLLRRFVVGKGGTDKIAEEIARSIEKEDIRKGARWLAPNGEFVLGREGLEWIEGQPEPEGKDISDEFIFVKYENSSELMDEIRNDRSNSALWVAIAPESLSVRLRRRGDRIRPLGMHGSRLVSDVVGEAVYPVHVKRRLAVIENNNTGEILWVEGLKRSRKELITPCDKVVWCIKRK
ncbi:MAG: tRNA lysidine(34) synthetase TilS [Muribaculaceae bacterium]|nr:tRNA lysidine(34) synthetase TilS [Muribaculaceae bacterium]